MSSFELSASIPSILEYPAIAERLSEHRIVLLGENGHGVAEFSMMKREIIRSLCDRHGFDLIVFESGMPECYSTDGALADLDAAEALRRSLHPMWHTTELLALFEYMKSRKASFQPIHYIGIDPRPLKSANDFLSRVIMLGSQDIGARLKDIEVRIKRLCRRGFITGDADLNEFESMRESAAEIYHEALRVAIEDAEIAGRDDGRICRQVFESRLDLLDVVTEENAFFDFRERWMARNLTWLYESLFPGRKMIVWAHNYHIRKKQSAVDGDPSMGEYLSSPVRDEIFSVGLYMHHGRAVWNDRREYEIPPAPSGGMEARLYGESGKMAFFDLNRISDDPDHWICSPNIVMSWGVTPETIIPAEQYDGVMLVPEVSAAAYIS